MAKRKEQIPGARRFEEYYASVFGERWPSLKEALLRPERQILRLNRFAKGDESRFQGLSKLADLAYWQNPDEPLRPERGDDQLLDVYVMDPASLAPALALEARPGDIALDVCAAPGGKSLILAEAIFADGDESGQLIANDLSLDRRERLTKVLQQYVPRESRDGRLFVMGKDGTQYGLKQPETFDRILLDAPCSGERHLLENAEEMEAWSPRRSEGLAARQYSLICGAWLALRPGGRMVYSTCALSPLENDEVIRKFLKKKDARLVHEEKDSFLPGELGDAAERTEFGWRFLPDRSGLGPIYFSILEKPEI